VYRIPTHPDVTGLGSAQPPPGLVFLSADKVAVDRLRLLDDALRQDVPGTDGWTWDDDDFRAETFCAAFDPATYVVAADAATGDYVGLARVWKNPHQPRLGLIGVLAPYRRRGLARALLAHVFGVLHERGSLDVTAEVDDANSASSALLRSLGAHRIGGVIEYVRRANRRIGPAGGSLARAGGSLARSSRG